MVVVCCGMYRSASTLPYQVVSELSSKLGRLRSLGFGWRKIPERRVLRKGATFLLKVHEFDGDRVKSLSKFSPRYIYTFRDIRDVICSIMQLKGVGFEDFDYRGLPCLKMVRWLVKTDRKWRSTNGVVELRYEDMMSGLCGSIRRIAGHIGVDLGSEEANAFAEKFSFESQIKKSQHLNKKIQKGHDKDSLFLKNHVRNGKRGKYADMLSADQIAAIESECHDWLVENGYQPETQS